MIASTVDVILQATIEERARARARMKGKGMVSQTTYLTGGNVRMNVIMNVKGLAVRGCGNVLRCSSSDCKFALLYTAVWCGTHPQSTGVGKGVAFFLQYLVDLATRVDVDDWMAKSGKQEADSTCTCGGCT